MSLAGPLHLLSPESGFVEKWIVTKSRTQEKRLIFLYYVEPKATTYQTEWEGGGVGESELVEVLGTV